MNCCHSPLVTGTRPIRNAGMSTTWAGRSLSNEYGSVAASTPSANGPAGTSTDVPARPGRPAGKIEVSGNSGAPVRRFNACRMVSSCWFSWLTTMLYTKAARSPAGSSGSASRASSAADRTVWQYDRARSGDNSGSSKRLARECSKASYRPSTAGGSIPGRSGSPPRNSQNSSC